MDIDLCWCPVCERAITEREELPPPQNRNRIHSKKSNLNLESQSSPQFTSRGGVFGPKGGLYCSEACRQVEELNSRRAFDELIICLSSKSKDQKLVHSKLDSKINPLKIPKNHHLNNLTRSTSLGPPNLPSSQPHQTQPHSQAQLNSIDPFLTINPSSNLSSSQTQSNHQSSNITNRRTPFLLAPNGTPLIKPTFPQRLGQLASNRPIQSIQSSKLTKPSKTSNINQFNSNHTSNSLPTYSNGPLNSTPNCLNPNLHSHHLGKAHRQEMEFDSETRPTKPTSLSQHYGLFYWSRSTCFNSDWSESSPSFNQKFTPTKHHSKSDSKTVHKIKQLINQSDQKNNHKLNHSNSINHLNHLNQKNQINQSHSQSQNQNQTLKPILSTSGPSKEINDPTNLIRKDLRLTNSDDNKCCRSWSWDHLPDDVPQYPAMDLERVRRSRLERDQKLKSNQMVMVVVTDLSDLDTNQKNQTRTLQKQQSDDEIKDPTMAFLSMVSTPPDKLPLQTRKKLFVFQ
ncbi:hypothetical protein O181_058480 [Austropuccinia psidii MF-1]|uniref:Uncharacterized protein n=1 Tax=Austropuccinia psidii MF-1 TaxID=1389203 RepID=A0A9Q3EGL1_9BASI|nr:hypothetical protein [Austropuccinia psidii MF-1]